MRFVLDNGVTLVTRRSRMTPAVSFSVTVAAGAVDDPPEAAGAMRLLGLLLDRGTETRTADDIADALDGRGVSLTTAVSRQLTTLSSTCLASDFDEVFALVGDIVRRPVFPDHQLAARKREAITELHQDDDNPSARAGEAFMSLLYPDGHPYGRPVKGTAATIATITRDHLAGLHARRFGPQGAVAVVVGDIDESHAAAVVSRAIGDWRTAARAAADVPPPPVAHARRQAVVTMADKPQADVTYGFIALRRDDPRYYACLLMNHVLGEYSLGGRLGDNIRERQGLAYYVSSTLDAGLIEGPLVIRAGVSGDHVDRTIAAIDDEVRRMASSGVTAEELEASRRYLVGALPRSFETNATAADFLRDAEVFRLGEDFDRRFPDLLRAVTLDEVNAEARRVLEADRAAVAVAGPYPPSGAAR